jgi:hypothetical protein
MVCTSGGYSYWLFDGSGYRYIINKAIDEVNGAYGICKNITSVMCW